MFYNKINNMHGGFMGCVGRLFTTLGILMILGGVAGMVFGAVNPSGFNIEAMAENLGRSPTAAELCKPGETLEEAKGASTYTQGQGYGRSVQYTCIDADGNRRDVTGQFVTDLFGRIPDFMMGIGVQVLWTCLIGAGVFFAIIGALVSRGRGGRRVYSLDGGSGAQIYINGQPINAGQVQTWRSNDDGTAAPVSFGGSTPSAKGTLAERLQQLENARNAGLISSSEYDRLRQKMLDEMQ
jgi:hypothetical protein